MKHSHSFLTISYLKHETPFFKAMISLRQIVAWTIAFFIKETFLVVYVKSFSHSFVVFACFFLLILGHGNVNAKFLDMIETR